MRPLHPDSAGGKRGDPLLDTPDRPRVCPRRRTPTWRPNARLSCLKSSSRTGASRRRWNGLCSSSSSGGTGPRGPATGRPRPRRTQPERRPGGLKPSEEGPEARVGLLLTHATGTPLAPSQGPAFDLAPSGFGARPRVSSCRNLEGLCLACRRCLINAASELLSLTQGRNWEPPQTKQHLVIRGTPTPPQNRPPSRSRHPLQPGPQSPNLGKWAQHQLHSPAGHREPGAGGLS